MTISPILPAGNGAGLNAAGAASGIADLFASLFSLFKTDGASLGDTLTAGLKEGTNIESLLSEITPELQDFANFVIDATNQQGITPSDIIVEFRAVLIEVQQIEVKFGSIGSMDELAIAYEKLGFSKEEAAEKAQQVSLLAQLLEAFKQHTSAATHLQGVSEHKDTLGILRANEFMPEHHGEFSYSEIRQTAVAFAATINITPKTDFVEKVAAKLALKDALGKVGEKAVPVIQHLAEASGDDIPVLDELLPPQNGETLILPEQTLKVAEFASPVIEEGEDLKANPRVTPEAAAKVAKGEGVSLEHKDIASLKAEAPVANAKADKVMVETKVASEHAAEQATARSVAEASVNHSQQQAAAAAVRSEVARPSVDNNRGKETRAAHSSIIASENGVANRNANAVAPVNGKAVLQLQPNENGDVQLLDAINDEVIEADAVEETRFTERLERAIHTAKHNSNLAKVAERAQVGEQVNVQVKNLAAKGGGHIRITLRPAELGQIDIQLKIADGKVHGTILSQNLEVIEQMARDLRSLQQGLLEAGLELDEKGIQFQVREDDSSHQQASNRSDGKSHDDEIIEMLNDDEMAVSWTDPDKIIDVSI